MEIITHSIRIINYENNNISKKKTPESFSEYIKQLISYIKENVSIREYKTRSVNTEVINSILDIVKNKLNPEIIDQKIDVIAKRLLLKEREAQKKIASITNIQKGSLIQALLYEPANKKHAYLLAKVEHRDFVDDSDFSFKSGFSKDKNKIWKSCIYEIGELTVPEFFAKIYSDAVAKYWSDDFLELNELNSDEVNTNKAFKAIEGVLNKQVKKTAPRDYTVIRNAAIAYFKSNTHIDYSIFVKNVFENYGPVELGVEKMQTLKNKIEELPEKHNFDRQFNSVPSIIKPKIKKIYDVYPGIQLKITDAVDNSAITAYRGNDGARYLQIKTDNDSTFHMFPVRK